MSERGTQVGIARARSGIVTGLADRPPTASAVIEALGEVMDPELPMVSIVDLGMIGPVTVGPTLRVVLYPTFVGCPAVEMIRSAIVARLASFGRPAEVATSFDPPWTSARITPAGLAALAAAGIAPPTAPEHARCPYCGSARVALDSVFGPTQCRSLFYCRDCRQPFEAIKPV